MNGRQAVVSIDGTTVADFTTHFSPGGHVGAMTENGYDNSIKFRKLVVEGMYWYSASTCIRVLEVEDHPYLIF